MEGKPEDMREAVRAFLFEHAEEQYRNFSKSLTPGNINMLGVRLPVLRKKAKELAKAFCCYPKETLDFLSGCMLDDRTYNRALQKMVESRIPQKDVKDYLRGLKRKPANRQ